MVKSRLGVVLGAALILALWAAAPAWAEPQRLSADPEPGAELHEAPERVILSFSEPLDGSSEIRVLDECRNRLDDGDTMIELNEMSIGIAKTPSGTYTVAYVASGVTGDAVGSYEFTVLHAGPSCDGGGGHGGHGGDDGDDGRGHGGGHGGDDGDDGHGGGHGGDGAGHDGGHDDDGEHAGVDHDGMDMGGHAGHDMKKKKHRHNDKHGHHKNGSKGGDDLGPQAVDVLPEPPFPTPSGTAVLGALALASVFGALGGWVLRVSGRS